MGIGNRHARPVRGRDRPLITTHGDWKPRQSRRRRIWQRRSHYPSWGLETRSAGGLANAFSPSLPLMGIGNGQAARGTRKAPDCSLPLMGIGNPMLVPSSAVTAACSLPLMGIGNRNTILSTCKGSPKLITPHGDWKLHGPHPRRVDDGLSLPLMGIGNRGRRISEPHTGHLITPHGDWKHPRSATSRKGLLRLITPHGDP